MINQQSQSLFTQQRAMNKSFQFTDEELIARFQNGDEQSYIELVNRYKDRLINFVFRLVNDRDQSEDIIQDTMLKLYTHKHYYKNIAKFSTWIYTIAGNFAKTELRKKKTRKVTNNSQLGPEDRDYDPPSNDPNPEKLVESEFINTKIHEAIKKLPDHFRVVTVLRDIEKLPYDEISNIVDVPLGTVKSRINRARIQLQKDLKDYI
jgi:RNA polymerase sigma-70 factor (ECF subfamily)